MLKSASDSIGRFLILSGWAILLFYFPSGWLHHYAGAFVYLRDVFLGVHLFASLVYLQKTGQLRSLFAKAWLLGVVPLFLPPTMLFPDFRVEMGAYLKWSLIWLECLVTGRLAAKLFVWRKAEKILSLLTAFLLLADFGTGLYEYKNRVFVIPMNGELSPMGVIMGKDHFLTKNIQRIKGLQRDVFSFANLMGMSIILGFCALLAARIRSVRVAAGMWVAIFSFIVFNSGGRSTFFGVGAAGLVTGGLLLAPDLMRRQFMKITLGWLLIGLIMSFIGVGAFTEWFGTHLMRGSQIGDSTSAYMRDDNWRGVRSAIAAVPIVLFTGSSLGSLIDPKVVPIFHWADNNYLWLLYHSSFISLASLIFYFRNVLARPIPTNRLWSKDCLVLFLLYVMGEAIARESLSFLGCIPLFIACGYISGLRVAGAGSSRSRASAESLSGAHLASLAVTRSHESAESSTPSSTELPPKARRRRSDTESFAQRVARQTEQDSTTET